MSAESGVQACEMLNIVTREIEYSSNMWPQGSRRNIYFCPDSGGFDWPNENDWPLDAPKPNMPGAGCVVDCLFSVVLLVPAAFDPNANDPALGIELPPNTNEGSFRAVLEASIAVLGGGAVAPFENMSKVNLGAVVDPPDAGCMDPLAAGVWLDRNADLVASDALVPVAPDMAGAPNFGALLKRDEFELGAAVTPKASADFGGAPAGVAPTLLP